MSVHLWLRNSAHDIETATFMGSPTLMANRRRCPVPTSAMGDPPSLRRGGVHPASTIARPGPNPQTSRFLPASSNYFYIYIYICSTFDDNLILIPMRHCKYARRSLLSVAP